MPKGRSLHIGVNSVDPARYCWKEYKSNAYKVFIPGGGPGDERGGPGDEKSGPGGNMLQEVSGDSYVIGWSGPLGTPSGTLGCEKDADDMEAIAKQQGFEPREILKTKEATADAVWAAIEKAAEELQAGDMFFVTYSGHGAHVKDLNGDEPEGYDETWCLYDRMLLDDEQAYLYSKFRPGVRIFVLLDSCHSGTGTRGRSKEKEEEASSDENIQERCAPRGLDKSIYEFPLNTDFYDNRQTCLIEEIKKQQKDNPQIGRRNFNVVSISACTDGQKARGDKQKGGWLSNAVTAAFNEGKSSNYWEFHNRIVETLHSEHPAPAPRQDPQLDHGLSKSRSLPKAIKEGREYTEDDWAKEFKDIDGRRKNRKNPLPPLSAEDKTALRSLAKFLADQPLRIA